MRDPNGFCETCGFKITVTGPKRMSAAHKYGNPDLLGDSIICGQCVREAIEAMGIDPRDFGEAVAQVRSPAP